MYKLKRKYFLVIACFMLIMTLTACNNADFVVVFSLAALGMYLFLGKFEAKNALSGNGVFQPAHDA